MARKAASTIPQEDLYPASAEPVREPDGARLLDLDGEEESPFLRGQRRVSVRRGSLPKKTVVRLGWGAALVAIAVLGGGLVAALYHYGEHSWRFRIESSDDIELRGLDNVTRTQVLEVMGADIGRNIFFIPLDQRQRALEKIPWVESASVMRFVPNRLKIAIHERTPVAFARVGSKIYMADASGVLMDLPLGRKKKYSFPVVIGLSLSEPRSTASAQMKIYDELVSQLDGGGARYSQDLSEVDISDPDDVKVLVNDPKGAVLVHLGSANYLERFKVYVAHVQEWRQQFSKLDSVDLRYDNQIVVNPEQQAPGKQAQLSPAAMKRALAAGVQPAVLAMRETTALPVSATRARSQQVVPGPRKPGSHHAKGSVHAAAKRQVIARKAQTAKKGLPQATAQSGKKPSPAIPKGQEQ